MVYHALKNVHHNVMGTPSRLSLLAGRVAVLAVAAALLLPAAGFAQKSPLDPLTDALKLTDKEKQALHNGEFVQRESDETTKKELSADLMVVFPQSFDTVIGYVKDDAMLQADSDMLAFKDMGDGEPTPDDFKEAVFTDAEASEIRKLADAEGGSHFNLSSDEFAELQALRKNFSGRCDRDPACFEAFNEAWKKILLGRMQAYRKGGLAGVAPYDRGGGAANPAEELRRSLNALAILEQDMPDLHKALMDYPASPVDGVQHSFVWNKATIQDRPTFAMSHRVAYKSGQGMLLFEREFYVSQSYNSLQKIGAMLPVNETHTLCIYNNRTSTDQVAGFASGARHSIGRKMMVSEIKKHFEELQAKVRGN